MFAIRKRTTKVLVGVAAAAVVFMGGAGTAQAVLAGHSSGGSVSKVAATETNAWALPAAGQGVWVNVPGMVRSVVVPSGTTRQLFASYNAESLCAGSGWCSVRIVVINSAGGATELHPQSGTDFAFDSEGDNWSSHGAQRTIRLGPGTYRVQVQAARVAGSSVTSPSFRLDEHYLDAELRV